MDNQKIKNQFLSMLDKFDALNERERISVMLLSVVAIVIIFVELLISPLTQSYNVVDKQVVNLQLQTNKIENQIIILKNQSKLDPDFQEKQKIKLLDEQLTNLNVLLKEKMHGLIEPKQMAKVLEVVLAQSTDLKLQRVQSLGAVPILSLKTKKNVDEDNANTLGIYRHGLQIEFKGSYLSTLKYLSALEALPWDFYWDVLELNVDRYPVSTITITVHTLSFHKGWIGV